MSSAPSRPSMVMSSRRRGSQSDRSRANRQTDLGDVALHVDRLAVVVVSHGEGDLLRGDVVGERLGLGPNRTESLECQVQRRPPGPPSEPWPWNSRPEPRPGRDQPGGGEVLGHRDLVADAVGSNPHSFHRRAGRPRRADASSSTCHSAHLRNQYWYIVRSISGDGRSVHGSENSIVAGANGCHAGHLGLVGISCASRPGARIRGVRTRRSQTARSGDGSWCVHGDRQRRSSSPNMSRAPSRPLDGDVVAPLPGPLVALEGVAVDALGVVPLHVDAAAVIGR